MALTGIGLLFSLASLVCSIIILVDAFRNEWWKGLLCLFCPLYILYYAFAEFEHQQKALILAVWLGAAILGTGIQIMGMQSLAGSHATTPLP